MVLLDDVVQVLIVPNEDVFPLGILPSQKPECLVARLVSIESHYDSDGRLSGRAITIPSDGSYSYGLTYNSNTGLLDTLTYPITTSGYQLKLAYTYSNGILQKVSDFNAGTAYWQANATNAWGQVTQETLGNGVVTNRALDAVTSWPSSITSGVSGTAALQNESYLFDEVGNVTQRQNNNAGLTENFYYDNDYRLDHSNLNGTLNLQMSYAADGNISSRSDLAGGATWSYDPTHKHGVTQAGSSANTYTYDANGNATSRNGLGITWSSYNHPLIINSSGSGESVSFAYNHNHERWAAVLSSSAGVETTYFIGGLLEKVNGAGVTDYRHYIFAGNTKVAIYSRTLAGVNTVHYVREDQQGSAAVILNSDGTQYVKESFTAFGARRSTCTWSGPPTNGQLTKINSVTRHGYTWQTALGSMGLNDMNGRIQDGITGRFLSADPGGVDPGATQSWNRYSYVRNNPLTFTDPTGFAVASGKNRNGNAIVGPVVSRLADRKPDLASSLFGGASEAIGAPSLGSVDGMSVYGDNANLGSLDLNNSGGSITVIGGASPGPDSSQGGSSGASDSSSGSDASQGSTDAAAGDSPTGSGQSPEGNLYISPDVVCVGGGCPGHSTVPLIPATYPNGVWIENARTGGPLLIPQTVSLSASVGLGLYVRGVPPGVRGTVMASIFAPGGSLDYQRTFSNNGNVVGALIDAGYYQYGLVAAAAGYSLSDTLSGAGWANMLGSGDKTGPDGTNGAFISNTVSGWEDYNMGQWNVLRH